METCTEGFLRNAEFKFLFILYESFLDWAWAIVLGRCHVSGELLSTLSLSTELSFLQSLNSHTQPPWRPSNFTVSK